MIRTKECTREDRGGRNWKQGSRQQLHDGEPADGWVELAGNWIQIVFVGVRSAPFLPTGSMTESS